MPEGEFDDTPIPYRTLTSGVDLKTVNGESIVGAGNVSISGGEWGGIAGTLSAQSDLAAALAAKQAALVAGSNLKTINGDSLLGSGDLAIEQTVNNNNVTTSGGNMTALSSYSGDIEDALADIGATPMTLLHDTDSTADVIVPENVQLLFTNGTGMIGDVEFEGVGLADPLSKIACFDGAVEWTGDVYPSVVSTDLWATSLLSDKLKSANAAFTDKWVTIKCFPGTLSGTHFTLTAKKKIWFTRGFYPNTMDEDMVPLIRFEDNVEICGDGMGQTIIEESSVPLNVRLFYAAASATNPFAGLTENVNIHDFTVQGSSSQTYDSGASTIEMGNVRNGHVYRVGFEYTHGFAVYFGLFGSAGHMADGWSLTECLIRGIGTQCIGAISGRNGTVAYNKILEIQPDPSAPFAAVMDFEPNEAGAYQENLQVIGNFMDGRQAQAGWSGVVMNPVDVPSGKNNLIAYNTCIGADTQTLDFLPAGVNTTANTITILDHKAMPGQKFIYFGGGTDIGGLTDGTVYWLTPIDNDTVKVSTSFANYDAGTFVDLTTQGVGMHQFTSYSHLTNAVIVTGGLDTDVVGNKSVGATQGAFSISNSSNLNVHDNVGIRSGGGGSPAMFVQGVANSRFNRNIFTNGEDLGVSQSTDITESESSWLVSTSGITVTHLTPNGFRPFWKGKTVTINSVDYTVARIIDNYTMELTSTAGTQSGVTMTTKFVSNTYKDNECGTITLVGTSRSISPYDDRRKGTVTINPASLAANTMAETSVTITGAAVGDSVVLTPPTAGLTAGLLVGAAYVSATNTVKLPLYNTSGAPIDEPSASWNYTLFR